MARKSNKTKDDGLDAATSMQRAGVTSTTGTESDLGMRDMAGRRTVVGVFDQRDDAERAIRELKDAGFAGDQIGIAMRDRDAQGQLVEETGTHAAEGAVTGAVGGGILGGLAGLLIGIGALAIPGIGPVVAGGALATAFGTTAGTAVAGAGIGVAAGGIVGALVGMGVPEEEAHYFETGFRSGGILVSVDAKGRAMEAQNILERNNADIGKNATDTHTERDVENRNINNRDMGGSTMNEDTNLRASRTNDDREQDMGGPYEDPRARGDKSV